MHPILAEAVGGMLIAGVLMYGGLAASVLALFALSPAARGHRSSTFKLIAPAVVVGFVNLCLWGFWFVKIICEGHPEMLLSYSLQWFVYFTAPLGTSLLAVIVLQRRKRKEM
jgi:hypothetical protein